MRVLIAEDDDVTRGAWSALVGALGHDVEAVADGEAAWARVQGEPFDVVMSDWMMPGLDGLELCRRVKALEGRPYCYVLIVSQRRSPPDVVAGLMAGADDFMRKPVDASVIQARFHSAERVIELERRLGRRVAELETALTEVKTLRGLLPVCMYCKNVRRGDDMWQGILEYIQAHTDAGFSHGICPDCYESHVKPMLEEYEREHGGGLSEGGPA